jgi:hypothetical protein
MAAAQNLASEFCSGGSLACGKGNEIEVTVFCSGPVEKQAGRSSQLVRLQWKRKRRHTCHTLTCNAFRQNLLQSGSTMTVLQPRRLESQFWFCFRRVLMSSRSCSMGRDPGTIDGPSHHTSVLSCETLWKRHGRTTLPLSCRCPS